MRDRLFALALAVLYCVEIAAESAFDGQRVESFSIALGFCAALAVRRSLPAVAMAAAIGLIELSNLIPIQPLAETGAFLIGLLLAIYSVGRYATGRQWIAGCLLLVAMVPLAANEPGNPFTFADLAFFAVLAVGPLALGRFVRGRRDRERAVGERSAAEAVAEERTRIARELHDVVAHAISLIVVQARGARRMLAEDPDEAAKALGVIEGAGSDALVEMRRLLGLLRRSDADVSLAPQPSLRRIDDLVEGIRASGLPVEVVVEGEPVDLPPGVDVSAYRIVQEALTNALKHAGPARARVTISYGPDAVALDISDDGAGGAGSQGKGYGLAGMRERVAVYGGELESGSRPEGGYALKVRLPLPSA